MKRVLIFLSILIATVSITLALQSQTKPQPPKTYTVALTPDQWNNVLSGLESIKNSVKVSNMPARESTFISDSLISIYQNEFIRQINKQIEVERSRPEPKRDSIKPKK